MERGPKQESLQATLKAELISGHISLETFLKRVVELDQSTPSRDQAFENLKLLQDADIQNLFSGEHRSDYLAILSLTQFHIGQAYAESDSEKALDYFESALTSAREIDWYDANDLLYDEATIAYLKSDIATLEDIHSRMNDGRNKTIVENFIQGLKERGVPDYRLDYSK